MKKIKIATVFNAAIFIMAVLGTVFTLFEVKMTGADNTTFGISAFKFFTVQSNVIMGVMSGVFTVYGILLLTKKISEIPKILYQLKLIFTVGVVLTFLTVVCYLAPIVDTGFFSLFTNANLFFHFLIPVCSAVVFLFFENRNDIPFYVTFIGLSHMFLYSVFYLTVVFTHMEGGVVPIEYDWYAFFAKGIWTGVIVCILILAVTYLISFLLWLINRKLSK